jgi:ABC-type glycerol-3-phosphate transport system permease component
VSVAGPALERSEGPALERSERTVALASGRTRRDRRRRRLVVTLTYALLALSGLTFSFPFLWTVSSSLKTAQETQLFPPQLFPDVPQWGNYVRVWTTQPVGRWIANSVIVVMLSVPGAALSGVLVAYSFARFDYPGRGVLFMLLLSTLMLPFEVTLIPQYLFFYQLKWIDTFLPLTVPAWFGSSAFTVFLLRQFFLTIPKDFDDAARVDGASSLRILWDIILPLSRPALATIVILQFLSHWNDFLGPFVYLNSRDLFTMSIGLRYFQTVPEQLGEPKEHLLMVTTVIMTTPAILAFFAAQRYFIRGIVMTGLKL